MLTPTKSRVLMRLNGEALMFEQQRHNGLKERFDRARGDTEVGFWKEVLAAVLLIFVTVSFGSFSIGGRA
jgi:hypothetical protein